MSLELGIAPFALDADGATALEPLLRQARLAEDLGFHSVWFPESHFLPRGAVPAPLLLMTAVVAATRRIKVGATSLLLPVRNAIQTAEEIAVLDRLSGGRVIVGIGRGFRPALFEAFRVPPHEKRDRFEAALEQMRAAWRGEPVCGETEVHPRPVQKPHPPVWVAAFGPKALAQAGRLGLAYLASPVETLDILEENYALHREALPPGLDAKALPVPVMRTAFIAHDRAEAARVRSALEAEAQALRAVRARRLSRAGQAGVDEWALVGSADEVAERVKRYRERVALTHLIFRVQVPGSDGVDPLHAIERLAALRETL